MHFEYNYIWYPQNTNFSKTVKKVSKQERPIDTGIKVGCLFTPKWNIEFLEGGIHIGKTKHKKSTFSWCFFVQKTMKAKIVNNEKY